MAAASGTSTDWRSSETPPEPYEESAKAEQPRPITTETTMHSDLDEQILPKREPERVEIGSVFSPAPPWQCGRGFVTSRQGALNGQGGTRRGRRQRRRGVVDRRLAGADASEVFLVDRRLAGADDSGEVFLVDVRSEQRRKPVGVDAADRGEVLGGLLGAVDQVGRGGGLPLVDALRRVTCGRDERSHSGSI